MGHELRSQPLRGHNWLRQTRLLEKVVLAEGHGVAEGVVNEVRVPL